MVIYVRRIIFCHVYEQGEMRWSVLMIDVKQHLHSRQINIEMSYDHHSHSHSPSINNTTHPPAEHRGNAESSAGSPQSLFAAGRPLPDSRDVSAHTFHDVADNGVSMKRSRTKWEGSLPMVGSSSIDGIDLSRTAGGMNTMGSETWDMAAVGEAEDDDAGKTSAKGNRKRRRSSASGILTLTSEPISTKRLNNTNIDHS